MNRQRIHTQSYYRLEGVGDDICDLSERLIVNCSGVSVIDTPFRSHRPLGRHDYYLMYLTQGELELWSGERHFLMHPGDAIIHRPGQSYGYQLTKEERMVYLWVHFTGSEAAALLEKRNLQLSEQYHTGGTEVIGEDFEAMQRLFITRPPFYLEEAAARLELLLTHLARAVCSAVGDRRERIHTSLNYLNRHYAEPVSLEALASMEFLSSSRYSALFHQITGLSPQQYLIGLRLKNARDLLLSTDLSIAEVARSVGYDDALYFSRLFHRHFGMAPRSLRTGR